MTTTNDSAAVTGAPRALLRVEGLMVLALAVLLYARGGHSWAVFALAFLAPDLSFAGYAGGARLGAAVRTFRTHTANRPAIPISDRRPIRSSPRGRRS